MGSYKKEESRQLRELREMGKTIKNTSANAWKVDRVTANHSLSSTAIQQKAQLSLSLLSLSWDVTARHKNEEKNRQAVRFGQHTSSHFYLSCRLKPLEITVIEMYCPRI